VLGLFQVYNLDLTRLQSVVVGRLCQKGQIHRLTFQHQSQLKVVDKVMGVRIREEVVVGVMGVQVVVGVIAHLEVTELRVKEMTVVRAQVI
jgi:hypothetical protein